MKEKKYAHIKRAGIGKMNAKLAPQSPFTILFGLWRRKHQKIPTKVKIGNWICRPIYSKHTVRYPPMNGFNLYIGLIK